MHFLLHGNITPAVKTALTRHGHTGHAITELPPDAPDPAADNPREFLKHLHAKQWHLLTTDTALIRQLYEEKLEFPAGLIVHLLDDPGVQSDPSAALDRLFARYKRLTPKRLYTVTAARVKIRQLPGASE